MNDFIQCSVNGIQATNNGVYLRCRVDEGAVALTEQQIIDQYATSNVAQMDQEDFVILGSFATLSFAIAYGVKILRNSFGDK